MIVRSLDGHKSKLKLNYTQYEHQSELHKKAISLLHNIYPYVPIAEEVSIEVERGKTLYLDIFLPKLNLAVEIHGEQHFKFIHHFHTTKANFYRNQHNDILKKEWCELNNIELIELIYNENTDQWSNKLKRFS